MKPGILPLALGVLLILIGTRWVAVATTQPDPRPLPRAVDCTVGVLIVAAGFRVLDFAAP